MYKIGTATNPINSIFWWRVAEVGVIFIPVLLTHFVVSLLKLNRKPLLIIFYAATTSGLICRIASAIASLPVLASIFDFVIIISIDHT